MMSYIQRGFSVAMALAVFAVFVAVTPLWAENVSIDSQNGVTTVAVDNKPVLKYQYKPNPNKPYVSHWFTPNGVQILRDSPHDHVHHHALMYAIGIDGMDFWVEVPPDEHGRQVSSEYTTSSTADSKGRAEAVIKQHVNWLAPDEKVLAEETRTIRTQIGAIADASVLTWQLALRPAAGREAMELWGRHYFGLGMRFVESMDGGNSRFFTAGDAKGTPVRGTEKLTRADWCAVHGEVQGNPVTVAMFDAGDNPRHPAAWFTMTSPFAYLAATLELHEKPLVVAREESLACRYGLALWDGTIGENEIQKAYETWLKLSGK